MGEWQHPKGRWMADWQAESRKLAARRRDLNRRLRLAFIAGAEGRSRETVGRGLTDEELERIIERYPGDVKDRSRANPAPRRVADSWDAPS
jgi:hypothetical protein